MTIEIIAEIGVNHDGNYGRAIELIYKAAMAGCDTVKFQLWDSERVYPRDRWPEMKMLELDHDVIAHLKVQAERSKLRFLCTPDDIDDARFLRALGVERIKIGSSNVTNLPLLREIGSWKIPVILSTGACTVEEMWDAMDAVNPGLLHEMTIMHCVSCYPAPFEQMNMRMIRPLGDICSRVGFSDHTLDANAALMALALGATVFEKHFTYSTTAEGPDHAMSLDCVQMGKYVETLRAAEKALGEGVKVIQPCERENRIEYERFVAQQKVWRNADAVARAE